MGLSVVEKASRTDVGRQRQSNEDSFLEREPLFAVADGMGGARAGEVASRLAVEAFDERSYPNGSPEEQLEAVARAANSEIYRLAQEDPSRAGMGTTLTAALVSGREIAVGHVGDSRLYRLRDGQLERLTEDHSLVEELVKRGQLTPEDAEVHPQRSIITRALGPEPEVQVDTHTHTGRDGDVYLLCSDGLTGMVSEDEIQEILSSRESLADAADRLIAAANAAGGKDNITVVLFRIGADANEDSQADTLSGAETVVGGLNAETVRSELEASPPKTVPAATVASERTFVAPPAERPVARPQPPRRRTRRAVVALLAVILVAAVLAGLYAGSRQFWFVGTNSRGQVTLFQGLPYSLPFGLALYSERYQSSVPAASIADPHRRDNVINHQLRSHGDAVAVVRSLESSQTRP